MQTMQRHADPYITPWTERWPRKMRLGFGLVAFLPTLLLGLVVLVLLASFVGAEVAGVLPILFYVHVGAQFITLLLFGHLMVSSPHLKGGARTMWTIGFLLLAPVTIPLFWWIHIMRAEDQLHPSTRSELKASARVDVHDYDYTGEGEERDRRREDGAFIHEHPTG